MSEHNQRTLPPFPSEFNWPRRFIANDDIWCRPEDYPIPGWIRRPYRDYLREELSNIRQGENKIAKAVKIIIVFANEATRHAPEPLDEILDFVAWLSNWCRHTIDIKHAWRVSDLKHGVEVIPSPEFLRQLHAAPGWNKIPAMYNKRQQAQSAIPREIEELFEDDPNSATTPSPSDRHPHDSVHKSHVALFSRLNISQEKFARERNIGVTSLKDYLRGRWKGKVSLNKCAEIEAAIRETAKKSQLAE